MLVDIPLEELKKYRSPQTKKDDFSEFWQETKAISKKQPLNVEVKNIDCIIKDIDANKVYYDGYEGSRICGYYLLPKLSGPHPVILFFHGYGGNKQNISYYLKWVLMGYAVMAIDIRGQMGESIDNKIYPAPSTAGYMTKGIFSREDYYYRGVYLDCIRAIEFLETRKEIDVNRLCVTGWSQGGGLSLAAAALNLRPKLVIAEIPYLCHYKRAVEWAEGSKNVTYLVAFASTRMMGTCAILGQAVGAGAYLCNKYRIDPREVAKLHIKELQQLLLKNDCYIIEVRNEDSKDLARTASVTGSSTQPLEIINDEEWESLEVPCAQSFIVTSKRINCISLLLESKAQSNTEIKAILWMANNLYEFVAHTKIGEAITAVKPGDKRWFEFFFNVDILPGIYWIELSCAPDLYWCYSNKSTIGAVRADLWDYLNLDKIKKISNHQSSSEKNYHQNMPIPLKERMDLSRDGWRARRGDFCFRISPNLYPYLPTNVVSGISRPTPTEVNIWISNGKIGLPQWLELDFGSTKSFNTIYLTFDTCLDHQIFERHIPEPECVRDYTLFYLREEQWVLFLQENGNYRRRRIHSFSTVTSQKIRLEILATNGTSQARIYEIRVYYEKKGSKSKK